MLQRGLRAVGEHLGARGDLVEDQPARIIGPAHARRIELGGRHERGNGSVHLEDVFQLPSGQPYGHQRVARRTVRSGAQRRDVERVRGGDLSRSKGSPDNACGHHRKVHGPVVLPLRLFHRVDIGIRDQAAQGVLLLLLREPADGRERKGALTEHLMKAQAETRQVPLVHLLLKPAGHRGHGGVFCHGLINGDQPEVQGIQSFSGLLHRQHAQVPGVLAAGDDQGIVHPDGLLRGGVGMSGDDHVDAVHGFCQLVVLPFTVRGPRVGQAHDIVRRFLCLNGLHHPLRGLRKRGEFHAGHGGAFIGVHAQQSKDRNAHPVPFQHYIVSDAIVLPGGAGRAVPRRGLVVGLDDGGQAVPAVHRGAEHLRQAAGAVVELVVAQGGHVISHLSQRPQFRGVGGVDGLEQGAHGEISRVQGDYRGFRRGALLPEQRGQAGIAAVFPALFIRDGQKTVVGVMGEQNGQGAGALILRRRCRRQDSGTKQQDQTQSAPAAQKLFHSGPSYRSGSQVFL